MAPAPFRTPFARIGIIGLILLMLTFLMMNAIIIMEGSRRLGLIDDANRLAIPQNIAIIDEELWQLHVIIDQQHKPELQAKFDAAVRDIIEKFALLETSMLAMDGSEDVSTHFSEISESLKQVQALYKQIFTNNTSKMVELQPLMDDITFRFNRIALWVLDKHQDIVGSALSKLKNREVFLRVSGASFVGVGFITIILLFIDMQRREQLLVKARQAERLKTSFFAMMSHEIRTPINGVLGMLTLLLETVLNGQQQHMASMAKNSAENLLHIVNDVLDYSKIEAGKLEIEYSDFSLKNLVENTTALIMPMARTKGLELTTVVFEDVPEYLCSDPARIRQILLNFLSNAVKFTTTGGIELRIFRDYVVSEGTGNACVRFDVKDSGIGIDPEERHLLFHEFSQVEGSLNRRFMGTGLGLAICARLAEMMKGTIGVISDKGKGSTFWFSVPLVEARKPHCIPAETIAPLIDRPVQILVAEDNLTNQMIASSYLTKAGHTVDVAEDGNEALKRVQEKAYDLVFMDVSMPQMDGLTATRAIRKLGGKYKQLPILAMTAHAMRGDREACLNAGMNGYISKPTTRDALLQAVRNWTTTPFDPILSCTEYANDAGKNPDGSRVIPQVVDCTDPFFLHCVPAAKREEEEIREDIFQQLARDLGPDSFVKYRKVFEMDIDKLSHKLADAASKSDWDAVKLHAHSLKSSVMHFGLQRLSALAEKIELQCEEKGAAELGLILQWPEAWAMAMAALKVQIAAMPQPSQA